MQDPAAANVNSSANQGAAVAFINNGAFICDTNPQQTFSLLSLPFNVTSGATVEAQSGILVIGQGGRRHEHGGRVHVRLGREPVLQRRHVHARCSVDDRGAGTVTFAAGTETMNGTYAVTGTTLVQNATVTMSGTSPAFTGPTNVSGGTLLVNGSQPNSALTVTGGTLGGSGTVGAVTSSAIISPGTPPATGILSVQGNFTTNNGATVKVALQGANAGTGFDQLAVTGTVSITGTALIPSLSGFMPGAGETFPIITSTAPIVGMFNGLTEGATVTIGGMPFTISYLNNAVTLRSAAAAGPAATTAEASNLADTAATLDGSVNPQGAQRRSCSSTAPTRP